MLIGANGAGKSNLVSFFKMMNEMMAGRLQQYIASTGHATSNLYFTKNGVGTIQEVRNRPVAVLVK